MASALLARDDVGDFLKAFRREASGRWICIEPTTFDGPNGRMQVTPGTSFEPGSTFMGTDLAKWLDEQLARLGRRSSH